MKCFVQDNTIKSLLADYEQFVILNQQAQLALDSLEELQIKLLDEMKDHQSTRAKLTWIERVDPRKVKAFVYDDLAQKMAGKYNIVKRKFDLVLIFMFSIYHIY